MKDFRKKAAVPVKDLFVKISQILPFKFCKQAEIFIDRVLLGKNDYLHSYFIRNQKGRIRYCIFRYPLPEINLLSTGIEYIFHFDFCRRKHLIPLLDLEYEWFFQENRLGEYNFWELVFQQKKSVRDAVREENVFIDRISGGFSYSTKACQNINGTWNNHRIYTTKNNWRNYYRKIHKYTSKCWQVHEHIQKHCDIFFSEHFSKKEKILGVMLREDFTAEFNKKLTGADKELYERHPLNPDTSEIIELIRKKRQEWGFNKIFLSTMYQESVQKFQDEFGDSVVIMDRIRRTLDISADNMRRKADMSIEENYQLFMNNREYFKQETLAYIYEVILLSRCSYYIAPHCSGSAAVLAFNGGRFLDIEVLENGRHVKGY